MSAEFRAKIESLRPYLLRYAALELRNPESAEDCVQEALLAALSAEASFEGRSNLRTWLTGILKHKIIDAIRRLSRDSTSTDSEDFYSLFAEGGHWIDPPGAWADPDAALEQKGFFAALEACLERLPQKTAQAFMMREHLGLETGEICNELAITPTHCWVLLYRARMALRECLEKDWFAGKGNRR